MSKINTDEKNSYKVIIGLEVHIEPNTVSKMFCGCPQDHFGKSPNTQTCPICLGLPGALPIANEEAIIKTIKLGLALGSEISKKSNFYRKHYFYPDLPKNFQTSQKDNPFCIGGSLMGKSINHIHLEEDAGKLVHETIDGEKVSLIDFNRSGCVLIELVTEPVFNEIEEAVTFLKELQKVARYLGISNADMEKGTMRLEANISLSQDGSLPPYKVELKNINSFRFLEKALKAEIKRQTEALNAGEQLIQETRGYDEVNETTFSQRVKADSHDYRYFPEADLPPVVMNSEDISKIKESLPELPENKEKRFVSEFGIKKEYATILCSSVELADFSETVFRESKKRGYDVSAAAGIIVNKKVNADNGGVDKVISELEKISITKITNSDQLSDYVKTAISELPKAVGDYKNGKQSAIQVILGKVMQLTRGTADPITSLKLIEEQLKS